MALSMELHILIPRSKRANIPIYSFEQHQRQKETVSIYSPHVVLLEGILALQDPRILDMLDLKIFVEADADVCLSRRSLSPKPQAKVQL
jgi:uridine kinase